MSWLPWVLAGIGLAGAAWFWFQAMDMALRLDAAEKREAEQQRIAARYHDMWLNARRKERRALRQSVLGIIESERHDA